MIFVPKSIAQQLESEGVSAYPNECCGILIGKEKDGRRVVERLAPMKNAFDPAERYHRFTIDPLAQIAAEKSADDDVPPRLQLAIDLDDDSATQIIEHEHLMRFG